MHAIQATTPAASPAHLRLRRQWRLGPATDQLPDGWLRLLLGADQQLAMHQDLMHWRRQYADGSTIVVLGLPIVAGGLDAALPTSDAAAVERALLQIDGQYVLICARNDGVAIYTDAAAMSPVFHKDRRAASTPALLPDLQRDKALDAAFPFRGTDDWYTGSLCPYVGMQALLANHVLDLQSGRSRRFWPTAPFPALSAEEGIARASEVLRSVVAALPGRGELLFSLTGGRDSRTNLAAMRPHVEAAQFFTIRAPTTQPCDVRIPSALARRFGLRHRFVDIAPAPDWLVGLYDEIAGQMAIGARREILGACLQLEGAKTIHVNGNLGAIAGAFFWPNRDRPQVEVGALAREFVNQAPPIMAGIRQWLATLPPELPPPTVYNLFYVEQRSGRAGSVGENAAALFYQSLSPFCSRRLFAAICGLPPAVQRQRQVHTALIRTLWPELLAVPFCRSSRSLRTLLPKAWKNRLNSWLDRTRRLLQRR